MWHLQEVMTVKTKHSGVNQHTLPLTSYLQLYRSKSHIAFLFESCCSRKPVVGLFFFFFAFSVDILNVGQVLHVRQPGKSRTKTWRHVQSTDKGQNYLE